MTDRFSEAVALPKGATALELFLAAMAEEHSVERAEKLRQMIRPGNLVMVSMDVWRDLLKAFGGTGQETGDLDAFGVTFSPSPYLAAGTIVSIPKNWNPFR